MRSFESVLATLALLLANAAAAVLVGHAATHTKSPGVGVRPSLPPKPYTTGSIPSEPGQAAVAAAMREVPTLLSYDYHDLSGGLARALALTTGGFRSSFEGTFTTSIEPNATADQDIATSSVRGAAYVSTGPGGAVTCLLFVDQSLERGHPSATAPAHQIDADRVVVTMTRVGDRWLISALTPV